MNKFLIITHSTLAEGFYNSTKFLSGLTDNVKFINAYVDESDWTKEAKQFLSKENYKNSVVVMTDIFGGSVNQKMTLLLKKFNFILITGVNLPLVLSLVLETEPLTKEKCSKIVTEARKQLQVVKAVRPEKDEQDDVFLN